MSILDSIASFFKKLWDIVKKVLVYILIICAILLILWACFFSGGALLFGLLTATQAIVVACVALAGAFLLDGDTANQIVSSIGNATADAVTSVGEAAGDIAGAVGGAVGDVAGGLLEGVLSSPIGWIAIGIGVFLFMKGDDEKIDKPQQSRQSEKIGELQQSRKSEKVATGSSSLGSGHLATLEA